MKMKLLFMNVVMLFLFACTGTGEHSTKDVIAVSILPQKYFVNQIAGQDFDIHVMIPPGASPATFDPSPKDLTRIADAKAYFKIGHIEFEKGWDEKMKSISKDLTFYDLSEGIALISGSDHGDHHHGIDPHVWMSVKNVKLISKNILNALQELNPSKHETYGENYLRFIHVLDSLDQWIAEQLSSREQDMFLIFHPALTYYARDYGLEQESLEFEGKQPTPMHFKKITEKAKQHGIRYVFIQKQFDIENAQVLANQINANIIEIDPLNEHWKDEIVSVTEKLKKALNESIN